MGKNYWDLEDMQEKLEKVLFLMLRTKQKTAQTLDMSCADYEKEATFLLYVTKSLYKKNLRE